METKELIIDYISRVENWKSLIKQFHWNSSNMSQHKLCDDIAEDLAEFQDQIAEVAQGILDTNFGVGTFKKIDYSEDNLKKFVQDVIDNTKEFYNSLPKDDTYAGMRSDCETFISGMQKNLYLVDFTMKEDFKRNFKNKMNENSVIVTEEELHGLLKEAIHNVIGNKFGKKKEVVEGYTLTKGQINKLLDESVEKVLK